LGAVHQEWMGVLWRKQVWLSCKWSNKLKKSLVSLWTALIYLLFFRCHIYIHVPAAPSRSSTS
jgi:hypothetical protein